MEIKTKFNIGDTVLAAFGDSGTVEGILIGVKPDGDVIETYHVVFDGRSGYDLVYDNWIASEELIYRNVERKE